MTQLVECIPNFSEGRRPEVVAAIVEAIASVEGVVVLDQHSDADHNRTVITYVGAPAAVEEAAFRGIAKAATLIDLNHHQGEHPRIGATDVVPFVPIREMTMVECVEMARRLGQRVGAELEIPVYLYEEAATSPERVNLENIRRGEYEALKVEIETHATRRPDFGPARLGPAGATVIGARAPLVAFNVYLTTDDKGIADKIARAVRNSSGGLRFVKALGMFVDGRAQVSMNLTNYRKTPIARVVEFVRREAARYAVGIHHCELVGLVPQEALTDAAVWYTQLDQFEADQVLEERLYAALSAGNGVSGAPERTFLDELASGAPTPGGGSAAAHAGAMAAALTTMVARLTVGKKKYADVETRMWEVIAQGEQLRTTLNEAVQADARAFDMVMAALKRPKGTPEEQKSRQAAIETATLDAARVPLDVARRVVETLELAADVASLGNVNALTDAGTAAALARAALSGASLNVRINLTSLQDQKTAGALMDELTALEDRAAMLIERVRTALQDRGGPALSQF
ncbi:MAG: hypothetical protein Fur0018_17070 [Anaerolineales bacterium]